MKQGKAYSAQPLCHKANKQICRGRAIADFDGRTSLWGLSGEIEGLFSLEAIRGVGESRQTGWFSLWLIGGQLFPKAPSQADHAGAAVIGAEEHVEHMQVSLVGKRSGEMLLELPLGTHAYAFPASNQITDFVVLPFMHIVKGTFQNLPFR